MEAMQLRFGLQVDPGICHERLSTMGHPNILVPDAC